jgi:hypothetical protein
MCGEQGETVARDHQILDDNQVREIIRLAQEQDEDGDFALVAVLLAATGARFSQLRRMSRWITEGLEELAARAVVPLLAA